STRQCVPGSAYSPHHTAWRGGGERGLGGADQLHGSRQIPAAAPVGFPLGDGDQVQAVLSEQAVDLLLGFRNGEFLFVAHAVVLSVGRPGDASPVSRLASAALPPREPVTLGLAAGDVP